MDYEARRDPDAILRQIVEEEAAEGDTRGKLKIFFGYAAGVGKTYAMLEEAHAVLERGSTWSSVTSNPTRGRYDGACRRTGADLPIDGSA